MKKKFAYTALTLASAAVLAACGAAPSAGADAAGVEIGDTVKLGFNFELSGAVAAYGSAEKNAADLAVELINADGGIDGKQIEVVSKDNKSETAEAATVATSLATQDGVVAIVGPATSGATKAAGANASEAGVPLISPSATDDSVTLADDGSTQEFIFRAPFLDSFQGQVMAKYAEENLEGKKVVLYYDNSSDYAKGIAENFKKIYGGEIVAEETFQSGETDFQAALTKIKNQEFDVLVVPGYYNETGLITKQARELGIDAPILGPDGFEGQEYIDLAGASNTAGVYYVSGFTTEGELTEKTAKFVTAYESKYGEKPNMFAALAFDSVYMVAEAAKGASTSKEIAANLAKLEDFEGVTGTFTIDEQHNPVKSAFVLGLKDGKVDTVETVDAE